MLIICHAALEAENSKLLPVLNQCFMSEKTVNEYEIIFRQIKNNKGELSDQQPVEFLFKNHDDVFKIIETLSEKDLFEEQSQVVQFVIGLKLFGDIMMRNRDMDLFADIQPAFVEFMKKLKGK